ncbi:hypothetical protein ACFT5B_08210 [Luteimicrobium sp. NPDC057192]|uniref:hypothetical protein n=1 Tax=Luteimicrobium sp. NPDC057192 TaxID=3346042 RepID=UPI0036413438
MDDPGLAVDPASPLSGSVPDGPGQRRQAFALFGAALAVAAAGIATMFAASGANGGIVWRGAFFVALGAIVGAIVRYRASVRAGASDASADSGLLACAGLLVAACLVVGVVANDKVGEHVKDTHASTGVGSCWRETAGDRLRAVDCAHDHAYVATKIVDDPAACGEEAAGSLPTGDGRRLCLVGA